MTWRRLTIIGSAVVAVGAGTAATVANVDVITNSDLWNVASRPYVDSRVDAIHKQMVAENGELKALIKTLGNMTSDANVGQYEIRLEVARNVLREAEQDLVENPNIGSLQRLVIEAEAELKKLEEQHKLALCYRLQIISEQDQKCRLQ